MSLTLTLNLSPSGAWGGAHAPRRWCSSGPARLLSWAWAPSPSRLPPGLPSPTGTAWASAADSTCEQTHRYRYIYFWIQDPPPGGEDQTRGDSLDHLEQLVVRHLDVARHVPGEVHHGNHGLDALQLVPLVALHGQLVLVGWGERERTPVTRWFVPGFQSSTLLYRYRNTCKARRDALGFDIVLYS